MQQLLAKLPQVRAWIDETLARHKPQARPVASYGFGRLPQYYSAATLASSFVIEVPEVPLPPLTQLGLPEFPQYENGNYAGITFLNTYFLRTEEARDESLHFHELVHVIQWQHLGPDHFLAACAAGYLGAKNQQKDPYRGNPIEVMAYGLQDYFDSKKPFGDVEPFIRRQIDEHIVPLLQRFLKADF